MGAVSVALLVGCGGDDRGARQDATLPADSFGLDDAGDGSDDDSIDDDDADNDADDDADDDADNGTGDDDSEGDSGDDSGDPTSASCPGGDAAWAEAVGDVQSYLDANDGVGAAVAVVCEGSLVHAAGFGTTQVGGAPVTSSTRFQLASLTKMFTGAAAVAASEAGHLDLHAPVGPLLPGVEYGQVTLHDLLTHTAGYPTEFAQLTSNDLVTLIIDNGGQGLWSPPGAVWNYSNPGFSVAGAAVEVATGVGFRDVVQSTIFDAAGMDRATMDVATVIAEGDYAYGHEGSPAAPIAIAADGAYFETGSYGPQGGAWGSVEDLARWAEVHIHDGDGVLTPAGIDSLRTPHTSTGIPGQSYGYGLFVNDGLAPTLLDHGGSAPGYLSDWRVVPELGLGVFVTSNAEWISPVEIGDLVMDRYVELSYADVPGSGLTEADYVGQFVDPETLGTINITMDGGQLSAAVDGQPQSITPLWGDTYEISIPATGGAIWMTFWRGTGETADYLVSIWGVATRQ